MECPNCGAQVGIHELKCPYCGTQNPEAVEYQKHKDQLEATTEQVKAKQAGATQRAKIKADLTESVEGAKKANKVLSIVLIVCGIICVVCMVFMVCINAINPRNAISEKAPTPGTYAAQYQELMNKYDDIYAFKSFHEDVNGYFACVDRGETPSKYVFEGLAYHGARAYKESQEQYNTRKYPEMCAQEQKFVLDFFKSQFNLNKEDCPWLDAEHYMNSEEEVAVGKQLRDRFKETHGWMQ